MTRREKPSPVPGQHDVPGNAAAFFSVIVPVYIDWHLVPGLTDSLERQTLPADRFEVILVDNGSPQFEPPEKLPGNVQILRCDTPGSYAARNLGASRAEGDWLVFTDADCRPAADWLAELDEVRGRAGDGALIAGAVEIVAQSARPGAAEIYDIVKGIPQQRYVERGYAATANLAVPMAVFRELGGFDSRRFSGGDADLCRRAVAAGHALVFAETMRVEHPARTTWREIATKARRIKGGQLKAGSASRRLMWLLRTLVPPLRGAWEFLRNTRHPLRHRLVAIAVLMRLWLVELAEVVLLMAGRSPERR